MSAVHAHVGTVTHEYRNVIRNVMLTSVYKPDVASTLPQSCLDILESPSKLIFLQTTSETLKRLLFVQTCLTIFFSHFRASEYDQVPSSGYPIYHSSNIHVQPSDRTKCMPFCLKLPLGPHYLSAKNEGSGEIVHIHRFA